MDDRTTVTDHVNPPPIRPEDYTVERLAGWLVSQRVVSESQGREIRLGETRYRQVILRERQSRTGGRQSVKYEASPAEIVSAMNLRALDGSAVDEDRVMQVVAAAAGVPWKKIDALELDAALITATTTRPFARRHVCLPLWRSGQTLTVALDNPFDLALRQTLRDVTGYVIEVAVSSKSDILNSITQVYGFQKAVAQADRELTRGTDLGNLEQLVRLSDVDEIEVNDRHVVNAVDYIFHYAFDQRASDIHFEPKREQCRIRMRIDGVLHDVYTLPRAVHGAVVSRVKMLARMDIAERRRPQDGRIKTEREGREVELRVSTLPVAFGEKVVMRIFDPQVLLQDVGALGFSEEELGLWERFIAEPNGIILVTGPTGSGKTTTLYSTLHALASPEVNITTVEDPIEMVFDSFNQTLVQSKIGLSFEQALRTILRQDPDIIMVGEIRDTATAQMAVQAAMTGHLVFSTLHTNDAPGAITRLQDLGIEPYKIASTLVGVLAQRLLRRICDNCRAETVLTSEQIESLDIRLPPGSSIRLPVQFGEGCVKCRNTGLYGRSGIFEVMTVTPSLRRMIKQNATSEELSRVARADGMTTLRESAIRKMAAGETSYDEVVQVLST